MVECFSVEVVWGDGGLDVGWGGEEGLEFGG